MSNETKKLIKEYKEAYKKKYGYKPCLGELMATYTSGNLFYLSDEHEDALASLLQEI